MFELLEYSRKKTFFHLFVKSRRAFPLDSTYIWENNRTELNLNWTERECYFNKGGMVNYLIDVNVDTEDKWF